MRAEYDKVEYVCGAKDDFFFAEKKNEISLSFSASSDGAFSDTVDRDGWRIKPCNATKVGTEIVLPIVYFMCAGIRRVT